MTAMEAFAEEVLDILERHEEWSSDTLDEISAAAQRHALAADVEGLFTCKHHYRRESDGAVFWADKEGTGWVVVFRDPDWPRDVTPASDVLYADWADADAEAQRLANGEAKL